MSAGEARRIISLADIPNAQQQGRELRAACPVHGGDNPTALAVHLDGKYVGFGCCYTHGCRVLVRDLNPDAAARHARGQDRAPGPRRPRAIGARDLLRPRPATVPGEPAPASDWQRHELRTLAGLDARMRARLTDARAAGYLAARGIPLDIAAAAGVGYIPADARLSGGLAKWRDRLVFPLSSRAGAGYIGRSLYGWQPGLDENAHKAQLDAKDRPAAEVRAWGHRWEKTNPAGWLSYDGLGTAAAPAAQTVVIVEGALDALALCAAGVPLAQLVALAGTAACAAGIPQHVRAVVLALDGDERGRAAAATLRRELRAAGLDVAVCIPPAADGRGKDWCERWRIAAWEGVAPVFDALDALVAGQSGTAMQAPIAQPRVRSAASAADAGAAVPWLADVIVRELLRRGFVLAEARMLAPVTSAAALAW